MNSKGRTSKDSSGNKFSTHPKSPRKTRVSTQNKVISRYTAFTPADAAYRVSSPLHFLKQFCQRRPQDRSDVLVNQALKVLSETFNFNFFGVHAQEDQKRICRSFQFAIYRKNEVIFQAGAVGTEAFLLLSGNVRCIEDAFRWVVTPGEDFGLIKEVRKVKRETLETLGTLEDLKGPFRNSHSAVALEDAWTLHLSMEELVNAVSTPTEFHLKTLEETGAFLRSLTLFKSKTEDTLSELLKDSRLELFKKGTEWCSCSSQTMYFIVKGEVTVALPLKQIDAIEEDSDEEGAYALQVSRNNRMKEAVKKSSKYAAKASTRHYPHSWTEACQNYGYIKEGKLGPSGMLATLGEGRYFGHEAWFPFQLPQYDLVMVADTQVLAVAVEKDVVLHASRNDSDFLTTLLQESLFLLNYVQRKGVAYMESLEEAAVQSKSYLPFVNRRPATSGLDQRVITRDTQITELARRPRLHSESYLRGERLKIDGSEVCTPRRSALKHDLGFSPDCTSLIIPEGRQPLEDEKLFLLPNERMIATATDSKGVPYAKECSLFKRVTGTLPASAAAAHARQVAMARFMESAGPARQNRLSRSR